MGEHLALAKREPDIVLLADVCFSFCPLGRFHKMDKIDFLSWVLARGVGGEWPKTKTPYFNLMALSANPLYTADQNIEADFSV